MKLNYSLFKIMSLITFFLFIGTAVAGQKNPIYENLPVGKYAVGFRIITITDSSRVAKPEYNYLGEKNTGDRYKKITIHLWYPAKTNPGKSILTYGDYCYNHLPDGTNEMLSDDQKNAQLSGRRRSVEGWFGKTTDEAWKTLTETLMLAHKEAEPLKGKFPLLIGMLRPLSTSVTNEVLASNGYVVAMIRGETSSSFSESALREIPDMQQALVFLGKSYSNSIDNSVIGSFGFSGSGFTQVLFAMNDYRIKAMADIESGIYMEGLFQGLSSSNYYKPAKLRAPFLHIFSRDLSKQEKYFDEFEKKTKFSKRYRLLLNQPALHHWDFAAEGYTSCVFLNNRGEQSNNIRQSFEIASNYLLNFFNAELKKDGGAQNFLSGKPSLKETSASLWDISVYNSVKPAPDRDEFEYAIRAKGIREALEIVHKTFTNDSSSNIMQGFVLNNLGYTFLNERKYEEAIGIFKLNTELHPGDANLFDSLAEVYEVAGDKDSMKKISGIVMDLLNKKTNLTDAERSLKETAEKRLKN